MTSAARSRSTGTSPGEETKIRKVNREEVSIGLALGLVRHRRGETAGACDAPGRPSFADEPPAASVKCRRFTGDTAQAASNQLPTTPRHQPHRPTSRGPVRQHAHDAARSTRPIKVSGDCAEWLACTHFRPAYVERFPTSNVKKSTTVRARPLGRPCGRGDGRLPRQRVSDDAVCRRMRLLRQSSFTISRMTQ